MSTDIKQKNRDWLEGADHGFRQAIEVARRLILNNGIHSLAEMEIRRVVADQLYVTMMNRIGPKIVRSLAHVPPGTALLSLSSPVRLEVHAPAQRVSTTEPPTILPSWDSNGNPL